MLYRIQSVALSFVLGVMFFLKNYLAKALLMQTDGLVLADLPVLGTCNSDISMVFSIVLSWGIIILTLYTIFKYNHRLLQLKLIVIIGFMLAILIGVIGIIKFNSWPIAFTYATWHNGIKAIFWLFLAFLANLFAGFKVYQDHCLVHDDRLR